MTFLLNRLNWLSECENGGVCTYEYLPNIIYNAYIYIYIYYIFNASG